MTDSDNGYWYPYLCRLGKRWYYRRAGRLIPLKIPVADPFSATLEAHKRAHIEAGNTMECAGVLPDGIRWWTEEEIERFCARWPRGTIERAVFEVLLYTGLRGA